MTFLMHRILRLKASAEHTQYGKLEVSISSLTQIIFLIPRREKRFRETWFKGNLKIYFKLTPALQRAREILI